MVSCLTFRSFIHFEFIFVNGVRKWSSFNLLHVAVHAAPFGSGVLPAPFVKETVLFPLDILSCFVKDKLAIRLWVQFWGLYSIPLVYVSVFVPKSAVLNEFLR